MSKDNSFWQDLPTIVELDQDGVNKRQASSRTPGSLDDIVVSPLPGAAEASGRAPPGGWSAERLVRDFTLGGEDMPMLVRSAAPLLHLSHAIRHSAQQPDIEELRRVAISSINAYERDLASARIAPERARAAHYIVCATVDDVVLSKPWGVSAGWARSGLVSTFHMDVTGGEKVFDLLDHFQQSPGSSKDVLLLIYLCLSLAFEGRMRVSPRGNLELGRVRDGLYKTLLGQYGIFERDLSPHWKGISARYKPLRTATALWTTLSILALLFGLGYMFFTFSLNSVSDGTLSRLASVAPRVAPGVAPTEPPAPPPQEKLLVQQQEPADPPAEPPVIPRPKPSRIQNFMAFLKPEVEKNLVSLTDTDSRLRIRINNSGLFDVGSAEVSDSFRGLLERIGVALSAEQFRAVVVGYTDNTPIRTVQYPSNWHLSEARAKAVGAILSAYTGPEAILTEGRADSNPIGPNTTPEGREMNRRTEILVLTDPRQQLNDAGITESDAQTLDLPLANPTSGKSR